jgi:hypothetical protein
MDNLKAFVMKDSKRHCSRILVYNRQSKVLEEERL